MINSKINVWLLATLLTSASMQPITTSDVQTYILDHKVQAVGATLFALLARPAYDLVQQLLSEEEETPKPYAATSLVGYKCGIKPKNEQFEEQFRGQVSVGSFDMTVKTPTSLGFGLQDVKDAAAQIPNKCMTPKRSAQEFLGLLNNFYPTLMIAIEDQTSPVVRDKEAGVSSTVKRLCAQFKCGQFQVRAGVDLSEAVMLPLSTISAYIMYQLSQYVQSSTTQA